VVEVRECELKPKKAEKTLNKLLLKFANKMERKSG
jgi:hypothetical protein